MKPFRTILIFFLPVTLGGPVLLANAVGPLPEVLQVLLVLVAAGLLLWFVLSGMPVLPWHQATRDRQLEMARQQTEKKRIEDEARLAPEPKTITVEGVEVPRSLSAAAIEVVVSLNEELLRYSRPGVTVIEAEQVADRITDLLARAMGDVGVVCRLVSISFCQASPSARPAELLQCVAEQWEKDHNRWR